MIEKVTVCLRQLGGNRAGEVRIGRWLNNPKVTSNELVSHMTEEMKERSKGRHILAIQDTTEINYQAHAGRVSGLGTVGNGKDVGFFLHPMLAVDGTCLGFAAVHHWLRTKKADPNYQQQPIEEKESYRWLDTANQAKATLCEADRITIIADRESDIYEEWVSIPDSKTDIITRASRDRVLVEGVRLFKHVAHLPVDSTYSFDVAARSGKRSAHKAKLELRFSKITMKKPQRCSDKNAADSVTLYVVDGKELAESVVGQEEPIHWCLLTTHKVTTREEALQIITWYCLRWNIEQLFRTLKKQGLDVESSQVETAAGLIKLVILALYVALHTMQLTLAREGKDQVVSVVFTPQQCEVLLALQRKLEGKTAKQKIHTPRINYHGQHGLLDV